MRTTVTAPDLTPPVGPFAQAVWAGDLLYASGQVGQDSVTGDVVAGGLAAETRQAFENVRRVPRQPVLVSNMSSRLMSSSRT
jgi:2-iminobutanoate/2-iminopropanoate deaminase